MAKILEILMIQCIKNLNWFNKSIINILTHIRYIIEVSFSNNFYQYLIEKENKIKQLLVRSLNNKFERFFQKIYKIKALTTISRLSKLIYNNLSLHLI